MVQRPVATIGLGQSASGETMPTGTFQRVQLERATNLVETGMNQTQLLAALSRPAVFGPGCERVERLETQAAGGSDEAHVDNHRRC